MRAASVCLRWRSAPRRRRRVRRRPWKCPGLVADDWRSRGGRAALPDDREPRRSGRPAPRALPGRRPFSEKRATDFGEGAPAAREVKAIPVPAGGSVTLAPGGYHVMLLQTTRRLGQGETFSCSWCSATAATTTSR